MDIEKYKSWTEFDWEAELKSEDENINSYTAKLSNYLDLPNESEVIFKHFSHNDSMPGNIFLSEKVDLELDDDFSFDSIEQKTESEIYIGLESLASEFSRLISSTADVDMTSIGIKILCHYGNSISKTLDMEEVEENEMPALKVALAKRVTANINDILGYMNILINENKLKEYSRDLESQVGRLFELRAKILKIQFESKST